MGEQSEQWGRLVKDEVRVLLGNRSQRVKQATVRTLAFILSEIRTIAGFEWRSDII